MDKLHQPVTLRCILAPVEHGHDKLGVIKGSDGLGTMPIHNSHGLQTPALKYPNTSIKITFICPHVLHGFHGRHCCKQEAVVKIVEEFVGVMDLSGRGVVFEQVAQVMVTNLDFFG